MKKIMCFLGILFLGLSVTIGAGAALSSEEVICEGNTCSAMLSNGGVHALAKSEVIIRRNQEEIEMSISMWGYSASSGSFSMANCYIKERTKDMLEVASNVTNVTSANSAHYFNNKSVRLSI